jgi:hypothetical protein
MHNSHAGKNDPRMLNDGARPHPHNHQAVASDIGSLSDNAFTLHLLLIVCIMDPHSLAVSKSDPPYETRDRQPVTEAACVPKYPPCALARALSAQPRHPVCFARRSHRTRGQRHTIAAPRRAKRSQLVAAVMQSLRWNMPSKPDSRYRPGENQFRLVSLLCRRGLAQLGVRVEPRQTMSISGPALHPMFHHWCNPEEACPARRIGDLNRQPRLEQAMENSLTAPA